MNKQPVLVLSNIKIEVTESIDIKCQKIQSFKTEKPLSEHQM